MASRTTPPDRHHRVLAHRLRHTFTGQLPRLEPTGDALGQPHEDGHCRGKIGDAHFL
jgi:hypothetical protein